MNAFLWSWSLTGFFLLSILANGVLGSDEMDLFNLINGTNVFQKQDDGADVLVVGLTLVQTAAAEGAVLKLPISNTSGIKCPFSPGSGANNWIIQLEHKLKDCQNRKRSRVGSSTLMEKQINFKGILSSKVAENPDFYNWNKAEVRYCDGASFSGDSENKTAQLQFRGKRIFLAVIEDLMAKGMRYAKQVLRQSSMALLNGCSSGGLSAILRCDDFSSLFPHTTKVKCMSDAGFFLDAVDISGARSLRRMYSGVVNTQVQGLNLASIFSQCLFPQNIINQVRTPLFILNSAFDSWQIENSIAPPSADPSGSWHNCSSSFNCNASQMQFLEDSLIQNPYFQKPPSPFGNIPGAVALTVITQRSLPRSLAGTPVRNRRRSPMELYFPTKEGRIAMENIWFIGRQTYQLTKTSARIRLLLKPIVKETILEFDSGEETNLVLDYENLGNHCSYCNHLTHLRSKCPEREQSMALSHKVPSPPSAYDRAGTTKTYTAKHAINEHRAGVPNDYKAPNDHFHQRVDRHENPFGQPVAAVSTTVGVRNKITPVPNRPADLGESEIQHRAYPSRNYYGNSPPYSSRRVDRQTHRSDSRKEHSTRGTPEIQGTAIWREKQPTEERLEEDSQNLVRSARPPVGRNLETHDFPPSPPIASDPNNRGSHGGATASYSIVHKL
ncbi:hypothetical protein YC2023_015504 [Brassica napus]